MLNKPTSIQLLVLHRTAMLLLLAALMAGCYNGSSNREQPLAQVLDKKLYYSDIHDIFPNNATSSDSATLLSSYIDRWVRRQLMLHLAEKNLTQQQKNVQYQLDDYRSSLLIFRYEQEYINQKLDTVISEQEVTDFYENNSSNFVLNNNLVKALYIQLPKDEPYLDRIRALYLSTREDDVEALDNLAYQVAIKYDYFNDDWIPFTRLLNELPQPIENPDVFLARNRSIDMEDGNFVYLVSIRDVITRGSNSPLSYEYDNIKTIILNQRKQRLIRNLEVKVYNDALNHNQFEVFID